MSISEISNENKIDQKIILKAVKSNSGSVKFNELKISPQKAVQLIRNKKRVYWNIFMHLRYLNRK